MSNTVHLNWAEKLVLFDIFDAYRHSHGTNHDAEDLVERLESELNRYGENHEQSTDKDS